MPEVPKSPDVAFDRVVYLTDLEGNLIFIDAAPWERFAVANGGDAIADSAAMLGRPLESFLAGDAVREQFRTLFKQVRSGARMTVGYPFQCDGPDRVRHMRLTMSAVLSDDDTPAAVLFLSSTLSEQVREKYTILEGGRDASLPIQPICAYCKDLEWPPRSGRWYPVEEYTEAGGESRARLSHGCCPRCMETVLAALDVPQATLTAPG